MRTNKYKLMKMALPQISEENRMNKESSMRRYLCVKQSIYGHKLNGTWLLDKYINELTKFSYFTKCLPPGQINNVAIINVV